MRQRFVDIHHLRTKRLKLEALLIPETPDRANERELRQDKQ